LGGDTRAAELACQAERADAADRHGGITNAAALNAIADYALGVFSYARTATAHDPIIVHFSNNTLVSPSNPAAPGEIIIIYATGIGKLSHAPGDGAGCAGRPVGASRRSSGDRDRRSGVRNGLFCRTDALANGQAIVARGVRVWGNIFARPVNTEWRAGWWRLVARFGKAPGLFDNSRRSRLARSYRPVAPGPYH
jgi:hypothetical protein